LHLVCVRFIPVSVPAFPVDAAAGPCRCCPPLSLSLSLHCRCSPFPSPCSPCSSPPWRPLWWVLACVLRCSGPAFAASTTPPATCCCCWCLTSLVVAAAAPPMFAPTSARRRRRRRPPCP